MAGLFGLWNRLRTRTRHKGRRRVSHSGLSYERYAVDLLEKRQMLAVTPASDFTYTTANDQVAITGYIGSSAVVEIPDAIDSLPVTSIGYSAFGHSANLTSVRIPTSVTTIGDGAFSDCSGLTSLTIPASVTHIGDAAFGTCQNLTGIIVASDNNAFSSRDGVLYTKDGTTLVAWPAGQAGGVTIASGVTSIGSRALSGCTSLTSVTIPASVTSIGGYAFERCTSLTSATIPSSVTSIGDGAFLDCVSLTSVAIPTGVTSIPYRAFSGCTSLTAVSMPDTVTAVGQWAFIFCTHLTTLSGLQPTASIGWDAFAYCNLRYMLEPGANTAPGDYLTYTIQSNYVRDILITGHNGTGTGVAIPDTILGRPVVGIGADAFNTHTRLESISIPDSVTFIGNAAFANCRNLRSIALPAGVTLIGFDAFHFCATLTSITLPASLRALVGGGFCFYGSSNLVAINVDPANEYFASVDGLLYDKALTSLLECPKSKEGVVVLPSTVTSIGTAFANCTRLSRIVIPASVTSFVGGAFDNCPAVLETTGSSPYAPSNVNGIGGDGQVQLSWTAPESDGGSAVTDYIIQYSTNGSAWQTFSHAASISTSVAVTGLTNGTGYLFRVARVNDLGVSVYSTTSSAVMPAAVPSAPTNVLGVHGNGQVALSWTAPVSNGGLPITDYTIQYSTDGSSWQTFSRAASATTSATVTGLTNGTGYLFRVASVSDFGTSAYSANSPEITPGEPSEFSYITSNGQAVITGYAGSAASVAIPATIDGLPVTSIGDNAFFNMSWITSLIIPSGVQSIGFGSFAGTGITTLHLPASVISFSNSTYACYGLATITVDPASAAFVSVDGILYDKALQTLIRCPSAREQAVTIPDTVTSIGYAAFIHCSKLTAIIGLQPTASIGWDAFSYCNNLRYMLEPSADTAPGDYLTYTIQSHYVNGIIITGHSGTGTAVAIPGMILDRPVVGIGSDAFNTHTLLESISIPDSVTGIGNASFANCTNLKSITLPAGVTYIGFNAFQYCMSLTSITLPESLNHFGAVCFFGSSHLVAIHVDQGNQYFASVDGVLYDKALTTVVECPQGKSGVVTLPSSVTSIGRPGLDMTFAECRGLSRIVIPDSVTAIVGRAFENCPAVLETTGSSPYAPSNVVGVRGDGQVHLSWTAPESDGGSAITNYIIQYSTDGSWWQTFSHAASASASVTVTGLVNGTDYLFRVAWVNGHGMTVYSAKSSVVTPATVPDAPTTVVGIRGNGQVQLSWTAPASNGGRTVKDYTIQYSSNSGSSWQNFTHAASTATSATVTGLTNGTAYLFRVASVNDLGTGGYSANSSKVTPATTPGTPTGVAGVRGNGQVQLSWTVPVSNGGLPVTDYTIQYSTDGSSWQTFSHGASPATSATVTGLTNRVGYLFRVAAVNELGTGEYASPASKITPSPVPLPATNIEASRENGVVRLSWNAPAVTVGVPVNDYAVQYSTNGGATWVTARDGVSTRTSAVISGLTTGRDYIFRVASVGRNGAGDFSVPSGVVRLATVPSAPLRVVATAGVGQVRLSWNPPVSNGGSAITQYIVQSAPTGGRWSTATTVGADTTTATASSLLANRAYSFRVFAVNDIGTGASSVVVGTRTLRAPLALVRV